MAMTTSKPILWIVCALMAGTSGGPASAAARHCTTEECACEEALAQNTIEALEAFLKAYPQSTSVIGHATACAALGVPASDKRFIDPNSGNSFALPDEDSASGG